MTCLSHFFHIGVWSISCPYPPSVYGVYLVLTHSQAPKLGPKHLPTSPLTPQYRDILEWIPATLIPFLVFCLDVQGKHLPNDQPRKKASGG